jgi:hypothetical protein
MAKESAGPHHQYSFKDFAGVNTQSNRQAIDQNQFAYLENAMPIGHGNLAVVPAQSPSLATISPDSATYTTIANIAGVDYWFAITSSGAGYQINLTSFAVTKFAPAATFSGTAAIAQWKNERILIIDANGYHSWDGTTLASLGGTTGAPTSGQTIATFSGRVWIGTGRTITFSAPNSYTDFTTASSGGTVIITDATLRGNITNLTSANNYLYVIGDTSINIIADIRVVSGVTNFTNTNLTASVGTSFPMSVFPFYRSIFFATRYGFQTLFGATPHKTSDDINGTVQGIVFSSAITGGQVAIYNNLCTAFLFQWNDPVLGVRPLIALLYGKKWFFCSQGSGLTLMTSGYVGGIPTLFATDGMNLFQLFSNTTSSIAVTIKTALWPMESPIITKQVFKVGVETTLTAGQATLNATIDTETSTSAITLSGVQTVNWTNNSNQIVGWTNNSSQLVTWIATGFIVFAKDVSNFGKYIGFTITSTAPKYTINGFLLEYETRVRW